MIPKTYKRAAAEAPREVILARLSRGRSHLCWDRPAPQLKLSRSQELRTVGMQRHQLMPLK